MGTDSDNAAAARRAAAEAAAREAVDAATRRLAEHARRGTGAHPPAAGPSPVIEEPDPFVEEPRPRADEPLPVEGELVEPTPEPAPVLDAAEDPLWGAVGGFADGFGEAALELGGGLRFLAAHPLEAAQALAGAVSDPARLGDAGAKLWDEARAGGWAHAAGFLAASAAPLLLGPAGAIVVAGLAAEKLAEASPPA